MKGTRQVLIGAVLLFSLAGCVSGRGDSGAATVTPAGSPSPAVTESRPATSSAATPSPTPLVTVEPTATFVPLPTLIPSVTPVVAPADPAALLGIATSPLPDEGLLLAAMDGSLLHYDLADGAQRVLLPAGLYDLAGDNRLIATLNPVRYSPDGQWLLVPTPADGTWLVSADGETQRQIHAERIVATWAPDSRRIVFTNVKGPDTVPADYLVWVQDVVGGEPAEEVAQLPGRTSGAIWSPACADDPAGDCARYAAVSVEQQPYEWDIWLLDTESGALQRIGAYSPPPIGGVFWPSWSPDGRLISVFNRFDRIAFSREGDGPWPLISVPGDSSPGVRAPDGRLYARRASTAGADERYDLIIGRTDDGREVLFPLALEQVERLEWSADGRRVLLPSYACRPEPCRYVVWAVDPAVGRPERIAEVHAYLGTVSALRQRSTEVTAPLVSTQLRPTPALAEWATFGLPEVGVQWQAPAGWFAARDERSVMLANFETAQDEGAVALSDKHLVITLRWVDWFGNTPDYSDLAAVEARNQGQVRATAITVDGRQGVRIRPVVSPVCERIHLPHGGGEVEIHYCPAGGEYGEVIEQILASLSFAEQ